MGRHLFYLDPDKVRKIAGITGRLDFREWMLNITGADACIVRISHDKREPALVREVASTVGKEDVIRYLTGVKKRRNFALLGQPEEGRALKERFPPPSRMWRHVYRNFPQDRHKLNAIVIGAAGDLTEGLVPLGCYVAPWPSNLDAKQGKEGMDEGPVQHHEFDRRNIEPEDLTSEFDVLVRSGDIRHPGLCDELQECLLKVAQYHLADDTPVSLVILPIGLRERADHEPKDFFSVELMWFQRPILCKRYRIVQAALIANYVVPRITFPVETQGLFCDLLSFAKKVKAQTGPVHDEVDWIENGHEFVATNGRHVFGEPPAALFTSAFHIGLTALSGLEPEKAEGVLNIRALFALAATHLIRNHQTAVKEDAVTCPTGQDDAPAEIAGCTADYAKWSTFLTSFDSGRSDYSGGKEDNLFRVEYKMGRLTLEYRKEGTVTRLMESIVLVYHDRRGALNSRKVSSAFVSALLPNGSSATRAKYYFSESLIEFYMPGKNGKALKITATDRRLMFELSDLPQRPAAEDSDVNQLDSNSSIGGTKFV